MSELFRKESMERVNSPERLNDYIRVSNPSVWMVLSAVIVLLAGVCVWGIFGHLDTTLDTVGACLDGTVTCYISEADISDVTEGTPVSINGDTYSVAEVAAFSVKFGDAELSELLSASELTADAAVRAVTVSTPGLADGSYAVSIIIRRETPMSFVLN